MTTLSDRLAASLIALEDAANDYAGTSDAILSLCTAARAWTRVADEVDGVASIDDLRSDYDARGDELRKIHAARERLAEQVGADDIGWDLVAEAVDRLKARAEAAERRVAEATRATDDVAWSGFDADGWQHATVGALRLSVQRRIVAPDGNPMDGQMPRGRVEWPGVGSLASFWNTEEECRAYAVEKAMGVNGATRAEQTARVAELEAAYANTLHAWQVATGVATPAGVRVLTLDAVLAVVNAERIGYSEPRVRLDLARTIYDALTDPGPVVLPVACAPCGGTFGCGEPCEPCEPCEAATPRDEEIAKEIIDHLTAAGPRRWVKWEAFSADHKADLTAAVASVVRPLLARPEVEALDFIDVVFDGPPSHESGRFVEVEDPNGRSGNYGEWIDRGDGMWALRLVTGTATARPAQTCPQCDADEIHCAGCGTNASRAWTCYDCAAGGDAGREADRLRGAVVEAARDWNDAATDAAENECANLSEAVDAFDRHKAPARVAQPSLPTVDGAAGEWTTRTAAVATKDEFMADRGHPYMTPDERRCAETEWNAAPRTVADVTAQPPPAPSDAARLAAAIRAYAVEKFGPVHVASKPVAYSDEDAAGVLRHLAVPLPGADRAEALAIAYRKALGRAEVRSETEVEAMRRAMLAVGATEPARVTVGEIVGASCLDENGAHAGRLRSFLTFAIGKVVAP